VPEYFLPRQGSLPRGEKLVYRPALIGSARLHFVRAKFEVDTWKPTALMAALRDEPDASFWEEADILAEGEPELEKEGEEGAEFAKLPAKAASAKSYPRWGMALADHLYRNHTLDIWTCPELKERSEPGESEGDFRIRLSQLARERRDLKVAKLEKRYGPKLARLRERIFKAEEKVGREKSQYGQQKMQTAISIGATVLGALFGRKVASTGTVGRATTAMRGMGRAAREKGDIARARKNLELQREKMAALEQEFEEEIATVRDLADPSLLTLDKIAIRPRKSDISLERIALVWTPWRVGPEGIAEPLHR
jgi:hypothetical protein